MLSFLRQLAKKWANWIGDRDLELALRKHLDQQGFFGDSATFKDLRLAAVQRPGWLQVYVFGVEAKSRINDEKIVMYGIVRSDERFNKTDIEVFSTRGERQQLLKQWSEGLIKTRRPAG
ncbi:MAG: hypothetical protein AAF483_25110 [Planctomycetota bacterium]